MAVGPPTPRRLERTERRFAGIPDEEVTVLPRGTESPLHHGSGLGLWLVHWLVSASGGDLDFADNRPRGSVVTLTLERA